MCSPRLEGLSPAATRTIPPTSVEEERDDEEAEGHSGIALPTPKAVMQETVPCCSQLLLNNQERFEAAWFCVYGLGVLVICARGPWLCQ